MSAKEPLQLTGALDGLRFLSVNDLPRYKQAMTEGEQLGFAYYFPGLLTFNRAGQSALLWEELQNSICVYRWTYNRDTGERLDIHVAPAPMNVEVLRRCLERANDYNRDTSARVMKMDARDAEFAAGLSGLTTRERKSQYLYSPSTYENIAGRKFRTIRRNIARVEALDNVVIEPFSPEHTESCKKLLRKWRERHREVHGTKGGVGTSRRIIELAGNFSEPDLRGEVIKIGDELVGFAFGGEIRPGVAAFLEAKCDFEIQGLSYFQRYNFMKKLHGYSVINDGSDVGRGGMAQLKNSLRPVGMHPEFRGTQTPSRSHAFNLSSSVEYARE